MIDKLDCARNIRIHDENVSPDRAVGLNGYLTVFRPATPSVVFYMRRNKAAHARCKAAIDQLILINRFKKDEAGFRGMGDLPTQWAKYLQSTRGDPSWWTAMERQAVGLEPATQSKRLRLASCVQCNQREAKVCEQNNRANQYCGAYCQFIPHYNLPDLRGMAPDAVANVVQWLSKLP